MAEETAEGLTLRGFTGVFAPAPRKAFVTRAVTARGEGILTFGVVGALILPGLSRATPGLTEPTCWAWRVALACLTWARAAAIWELERGEAAEVPWTNGEWTLGREEAWRKPEVVGVEVRDGDGRKPLETAIGVVGVCGSEPGIGKFFDRAISGGKAMHKVSVHTHTMQAGAKPYNNTCHL